MESAAKSRFEPNPAIVALCCVRAQHKKCRISEETDPAALRRKRPSALVAARISRRIHRLWEKTPFRFRENNPVREGPKPEQS